VKRLQVDQVVGLSVGDASVDCRVTGLPGGEAALEPLRPADAMMLPPASASATLVFNHRGGLVMLRGAMYRAAGPHDLRFAEGTRASGANVAEQRRRAARVDVALLASVIPLSDDGAAEGAERQFITRDISLGGLALKTGQVSLINGALIRFTVTLPDLSQIDGTARVVRSANGMAGLKFEDVAPANRVKLAGFLVSQQRPGAAAGVSAPR
jgi:hypothetical protein